MEDIPELKTDYAGKIRENVPPKSAFKSGKPAVAIPDYVSRRFCNPVYQHRPETRPAKKPAHLRRIPRAELRELRKKLCMFLMARCIVETGYPCSFVGYLPSRHRIAEAYTLAGVPAPSYVTTHGGPARYMSPKAMLKFQEALARDAHLSPLSVEFGAIVEPCMDLDGLNDIYD